jgi:hypothetical protein
MQTGLIIVNIYAYKALSKWSIINRKNSIGQFLWYNISYENSIDIRVLRVDRLQRDVLKPRDRLIRSVRPVSALRRHEGHGCERRLSTKFEVSDHEKSCSVSHHRLAVMSGGLVGICRDGYFRKQMLRGIPFFRRPSRDSPTDSGGIDYHRFHEGLSHKAPGST